MKQSTETKYQLNDATKVRAVTTADIKTLQSRLKEIMAVVKVGESPFQLLSGLKYDVGELMKKGSGSGSKSKEKPWSTSYIGA